MTLPPSPSLPAAVQTYRWLAAPLPLLDACSRELGDTFRLRLVGNGDWVMVSAPRDVKALFTADPAVLRAGSVNRRLFGHVAGDSSAFVLDGEAHLRHRRLVLPAFHGERMHAYGELIRDATEKVVAGWPVERAFPLMEHVQKITLLVTMRAVFGVERGQRAEHLTELMSRLAHLAFTSWLAIAPALRSVPTRFGPLGKIRRHVEEADRALFAEIAARRRSPEPEREDILSLLLSARDEAGEPLSDRELRDELIAALLGGHDTTGTALAWLFERILSEPEVRAKVEAELEAVVGGARLCRDHFGKLPYLDAVIKETLRARPIAPIGGLREVTSDFEIAGYTLPRGTTVASCAYLTFRRPDLYPEPERFLPERFLGKKIDPYEWAAFGGGVRRCLGMAFALYLMKVVAATVLSQGRLRIEQPRAPGVRHGFFVAPRGGPRIALVERLAPARAAVVQ